MEFKPLEIIHTCKGGGYMYARTNPPHPKANSNGLYPLHRVLIENKLKRFLQPNEIVHHRNENKSDNRIENLEVLSRSHHSRLHVKSVPLIEIECDWCKENFSLKLHTYRLRLKRNKTSKLFCSRNCTYSSQLISRR